MPLVRKYAWLLLRAAAVAGALLVVPFASIRERAALVDPDIWWHIRVGDWITQHHAFPHSVILSQHSDKPWVAYSWGFELLVSGVHSLLGLPGIVVLLILLQLLLAALVMLSFRHLVGRFWPAWLIATLTIYAYYTAPLRPVLLTALFFILELLLIFEAERTREDRLLFWIAPLFLLWANCHIQFIYGMFILCLYTGTRILTALRVEHWYRAGTARNSVLRMSAVLLLSGLASCLGPYGVSPYKVAFTAAANTQPYHLIQEMGPLSFRHPAHYAQLLLVMAACWALGRSRRRDPFRFLALAISAVVSFRAMRDSWFVCLVAGFILAESVRGEERPVESPAPAGVLHERISYAAGVVVALGLAFGIANRAGLDMNSLSVPVNMVYPVGASDFVRNSALPGPMFNPFDWGGFLIYNLPGQPVSIDGRVEAYGTESVARSIATLDAREWQRDPDLARANFAVLPVRSPLAAVLAGDSRYRVVYRDYLAVVFQRQQNPEQPLARSTPAE